MSIQGRDRSDDIDIETEGAENRNDESDIIADKDETAAVKLTHLETMQSIELDKILAEDLEDLADVIDDDIDIDETGEEANISV
jgi:hypothetical protein